MKCPRCQHENRSGAKFCEECGTPLKAANPSDPPAPSYAEVALSEALEQQAATATILRIISASPTNVQTVLDAVAESAARLCDARDALVVRAVPGGARAVANYGLIPATPRSQTVPDARTPSGRAIHERRTIHVDDLASALDEYSDAVDFVDRFGVRTVMATPLMHEGQAIGAIVLRRTEVRPFSEKQVALLETFADQAVIAIENARLFKELEARNRDLTEALAQQTATAEVLRAISSSPTDLNPVLDAVARNAARLAEVDDLAIIRAEDDGVMVMFSLGPYNAVRGRRLPMARGATGRAILEGRTVHISDILADPDYEARPEFQAFGWRTALAVPLIREGIPIGAITARRSEIRPFTDTQIALLQTFADQAVIAIENVRLFTELQEERRNFKRAFAVARDHAPGSLTANRHRRQTPYLLAVAAGDVRRPVSCRSL